MSRPRVAVAIPAGLADLQLDAPRLARLHALADVVGPVPADLDEPSGQLSAAEVLLTSWGTPPLTAERLAMLPALRVVLHCAGSVRGLVDGAVHDRGIQVCNAADANAVAVAEYTFAAIVMAGKKAPFLAADARAAQGGWSLTSRHGPMTNLGRTIGLLGFSRTGRRVVELVQQLQDLTCLVVDPYADPDELVARGARPATLAEMLPQVDTLSLHAPALPSTYRVIGAPELALLPDHATVINTARGQLVDHEALAAECGSGRLNAILDVTDPEPLPATSPLLNLPNVMITPHVAGSLGTETRRMTDACLDELERLARGEPLQHPLSRRELQLNA